MAEVAAFWGPQKISQTFGDPIPKNTRYPKIPDYSENISGRVRVLLKIIGYPSDTVHRVGSNFWKVTPLHLAKGSKFKKYFLRLVLVSWCLSCWVGWRRQTALSCCESVPPTAEQQAGQLPPNCLRCYEKSSLYFV